MRSTMAPPRFGKIILDNDAIRHQFGNETLEKFTQAQWLLRGLVDTVEQKPCGKDIYVTAIRKDSGPSEPGNARIYTVCKDVGGPAATEADYLAHGNNGRSINAQYQEQQPLSILLAAISVEISRFKSSLADTLRL